MRITCPNCSAQYEVDDALIPEMGRDVQCSNCGKGWFQQPLSAEEPETPQVPETQPEEVLAEEPAPEAVSQAAEEIEPETDVSSAEPVDDAETPEPEAPETPSRPKISAPPPPLVDEEELARAPSAPSEPEPEAKAAAEPEPEPETASEVEPEPKEAPEEPQATEDPETPELRRPDPGALSILREEAEIEAEKRRAEAESIETQPDLGLTEAAAASAGAAAVSETAQRGDLLPDIDRINSTLRASADRDDDMGAAPDQAVQTRRRGFRIGFSLSLLVAAILLLLYLYAPIFASSVPALAGPLAAYVDAVNSVRDMINGLLGSGVDSLS